MKRLLIIAALACLPFGAHAQAPKGDKQGPQEASQQENDAVIAIVKCMVAGLPEDWSIAVMEINLEKPLDQTGDVRYTVGRGQDLRPTESFVPCDPALPPRTLMDARKFQTKARQGWIGAAVTVLRNGKFGIRYGYPK